jgi:hypothetical protein
VQLPRLFVYHCEAEIGSRQSEPFKVMERRLLRTIINPAMIVHNWQRRHWRAATAYNLRHSSLLLPGQGHLPERSRRNPDRHSQSEKEREKFAHCEVASYLKIGNAIRNCTSFELAGLTLRRFDDDGSLERHLVRVHPANLL